MESRVVFGNTVDGMMRKALAGRMTPALAAKLADAGFHVDAPIAAGYPYESWQRWTAIIADEIFPELDASERYRQLGRLVVMGIRHTAVGKAVEMVLRVIGPARALGRMNRNFRTSDNFTQVVITELAPREVRIEINEVMAQPTYMQGVFETIVELSGGKDVAVAVESVSLPSATLHVRWS